MIIKFPDQTHGSLQKTRTKKETWSRRVSWNVNPDLSGRGSVAFSLEQVRKAQL